MQSQTTFSLSFWINATRAINNYSPVYARITVNGQRSEISLKRNVLFKEWDNTKNRG